MAKANELKRTQEQLRLFVIHEDQLSLGDLTIPIPKQLTVVEIVERIRKFVRNASEAQDMGSQLFGMDAEYAIQLVDVLTEQYDVVLMNPPYGAMPKKCKQYACQHYPKTHSDYYAANSYSPKSLKVRP
ncbi:MAG: BREX-1 system adenine-specific DNA-methyltransferase PglX [Armatimonadetes bacterium]|nr:BREX-1 system adenine-specific DNA-methyltransferase PglX [Armatimonadota bacterium]